MTGQGLEGWHPDLLPPSFIACAALLVDGDAYCSWLQACLAPAEILPQPCSVCGAFSAALLVSLRLDEEERLFFFFILFLNFSPSLSLWLFLEMASSSGFCLLHPCRNQFVVWPLFASHAFCQEVTKLPPDTPQSPLFKSHKASLSQEHDCYRQKVK